MSGSGTPINAPFCVMPWVHQYINPQGKVSPCCVYDYNTTLGDLDEESLAEIWNNEETRKLRLALLNNKPPSACSFCTSRADDAYNVSCNARFLEKAQDAIASTQPDGTAEYKVLDMDARFSNLCNCACLTCNPMFSSKWPGAKLSNKINADDLNLDTIESFYFAGGEPLINPEHYKILDRLAPDVSIRYSTNLTEVAKAIPYWKKFKNVELFISVDCKGARAEYWRKGTKWKTVFGNLLLVKKECPHVDILMNPTVSWPTLPNFLSMYQEWTFNDSVIPHDKISINLLDTPYYYSLKCIPNWKKEKYESQIKTTIHLMKQRGHDSVIPAFENIITFMWAEKNDNFEETFKEFKEAVGPDFFMVFPEHNDLYGVQSYQGSKPSY